ncbi:MAG: bifunctional pyr operon transcriptional regulator/uracil phosphoribosyltransferase PyrR [Gammaproteobacteria bacterium]|nr:bifunctional pyr operon transcriptional regulator/uracil phosphoribosyltransferase PyrR [Gammaproteobacteria bacterium]
MNEQINVDDLIKQLADRTMHFLKNKNIDHPLVVGIHTGGVWVAKKIHHALQLDSPLGQLDISFYRDDFTKIGINPQVKPSHLPFEIDNQHILLVDDVLSTGRTIRAALNELFDYGRPASITLVVLIERDGRELPIQADLAGKHISLAPGQHIKLQGPDSLSLMLS